jgi:hypothetical protein
VGTEGPPDKRSTVDKEQAAKNQILALARELAEACEHDPEKWEPVFGKDHAQTKR